MWRVIVVGGLLASACFESPRARTEVEDAAALVPDGHRPDAGLADAVLADAAPRDAGLREDAPPDAAPLRPPRPGPCEIRDGYRQIVYEYDEAGHVLSESHANGVVVTYSWDAEGRLRRMHLTNDAYSPCGSSSERTLEYEGERLIEVRGRFDDCDPERGLRYRYDDAGRLSAIEGPREDDRWTFDYDADDRLVRETYWLGRGEAAQEARRGEYTRTDAGWSWSWNYSTQEILHARVTCENGRVSEVEGLWMLPSDIIDSERFALEYDMNGRLAVVRGSDVTDDGPYGPYEWRFTYDDLGDLVLAERNGGMFDVHREYRYDCFDESRGPTIVQHVDHRFLAALPGALTWHRQFTLESLVSACSPHRY